MNRFGHAKLLALIGMLCVLANMMPSLFQPAGLQGERYRVNKAPQPAEFFPDVVYTLGVSGVGGSDNAHFSGPRAIATNATGHVYVADLYNGRVQVFDNTGIYQYTIGQLSGANGLAVNASGYLYIADYGNNCVQVFDNAGVYQYKIGPGITPTGVAINATGDVYVTNKDLNQVRVYDKAGNYQYTISGLSTPHGVGVNSTGNLYIADSSNNRVQVYSPTGTYLYTICGNGAGSANNQFNYPTGVAINSTGHVYVTDRSNNRVQVFDKTGAYIFTICGNGAGNASNQLNSPYGVAINSTGYAYIADTNSQRVQIFVNIEVPTNLTISINGGATETGSLSVTLTLGATGAAQMCFSNNGTTYTEWEAFSPSKLWMLDGGPGPKTVFFNVRNGSIEAAAPVSANIIYVLLPTSLSIIINDGANMTASRSVTLVVWASDAEEICFSNDGLAWSAWEPFTLAKAWGLAGGAGLKTVYFRARNSTIESITSANITYTLPPTALSLSINGGAEECDNRTVTLTLSATGATEMCFSNDGVTWSGWEPLATSKQWNVSTTTGYKTVYFKARNGTIESMAPVAASITYTTQSQNTDELPAWAWVIIVAIIVEGLGLVVVIWMHRGKSGGRVLPTALGGEKKSRMDLLKGKLSSLKGKISRRDATETTSGEIKTPIKVTEIPLKPALTPVVEKKIEAPKPAPAKEVEAPKPVPTPVVEKKVEAPKPAPAPTPEKKVAAPKPAPHSASQKKVEMPKPAPAPAPEKNMEATKPASAPPPEKNVETPKPVAKPTKKTAKKVSKKAAKKPA